MVFLTSLLLAPTWFGPVTVNQRIPTQGNPFAPTENDVRAVFTGHGKRFERLAYFADGQWHATLAANAGGRFVARFTVNGRPVGHSETVNLLPASDGEFVRLNGRRFKLSSGAPFIPFGHDFGWQGGNDPSYAVQLADMAKAGLNWSRIWSDGWDNKNPYVAPKKEDAPPLGRMLESALNRWDMVVANSEKQHIKFQFVLFHHGLFSSTTDANWADHPWNTANGGFLKDPTDFFIDPRAKTLTKAWLRYSIARWGHSPSIMAWELFNEVQWVDAAKLHPERITDVIAWHKEMGDYVRSLDPYHHLVTSSSSESLDPRVFETMDYLQPHTYPPSVYGAILGAALPANKPLFFGEFGPGSNSATARDEQLAIRDGFWGGILAGQAGPGEYWFWDRAYSMHLYDEFARCSKILARSGFAQNPDVTPSPIVATGGMPGDFVLRPGRGWAATEKTSYRLPEDAPSGTLPLVSGYVQGSKSANRKLMPEPLRFRFVASKPGTAVVRVGQVSAGGGALQISVNGSAPLIDLSWPKSPKGTSLTQLESVSYPAGENEIVIDNPGDDWITVDSITFPDLSAGCNAVSLRNDHYALARLQWGKTFGPGAKSLQMPGLRDGSYQLRQFDLDRGTESDSIVQITSGHLTPYIPYALDEGLALFRK